MKDFEVFKDAGKDAPAPERHKNVCVHLICDVKHDGRHCARPVADGHLTDVPVDSDHSGVASLQGFHMMTFPAVQNCGAQTHQAHVLKPSPWRKFA